MSLVYSMMRGGCYVTGTLPGPLQTSWTIVSGSSVSTLLSLLKALTLCPTGIQSLWSSLIIAATAVHLRIYILRWTGSKIPGTCLAWMMGLGMNLRYGRYVLSTLTVRIRQLDTSLAPGSG